MSVRMPSLLRLVGRHGTRLQKSWGLRQRRFSSKGAQSGGAGGENKNSEQEELYTPIFALLGVIPLGLYAYWGYEELQVLYYSRTCPFNVVEVSTDLQYSIKKYACAPLFIRLAWQSACLYDKEQGTGKLDGRLATMPQSLYSQLPCNAGIDRAIALLRPIKEKHNISWSDLIAFAGCVAVEELGGPRITFRYGREDVTEDDLKPEEVIARCPNQSRGVPHVLAQFYRLGFGRSELVALMGAHTVGSVHKTFSGVSGERTTLPFLFDTAYFAELLDNEWTLSSRPGDPAVYRSKSGLVAFPADVALLQEPGLKNAVTSFADNEVAFHLVFAKAFQRLLELGQDNLYPSGWSFAADEIQ